jgi:hypothetical protein
MTKVIHLNWCEAVTRLIDQVPHRLVSAPVKYGHASIAFRRPVRYVHGNVARVRGRYPLVDQRVLMHDNSQFPAAAYAKYAVTAVRDVHHVRHSSLLFREPSQASLASEQYLQWAGIRQPEHRPLSVRTGRNSNQSIGRNTLDSRI